MAGTAALHPIGGQWAALQEVRALRPLSTATRFSGPGSGRAGLTVAAEGARASEVTVHRVVRNRLAGNAFRDEIAARLRAEGLQVETEVYKRTIFGRRFIDIEVSRGGRVLGGIETKFGSARYNPAQRAKDAWLRTMYKYPVNVVRPPQ